MASFVPAAMTHSCWPELTFDKPWRSCVQGCGLTPRSLVVYIHVLLQHASMFIVDLHVLLQHAPSSGFVRWIIPSLSIISCAPATCPSHRVPYKGGKTIPYSMCSCNMVQLIPVILMARVLTAPYPSRSLLPRVPMFHDSSMWIILHPYTYSSYCLK